MAIPFDKEQREKAKKEGLYLVQISVDGKHAGVGGWALTGTYPKEMADELRALYMKWIREEKLCDAPLSPQALSPHLAPPPVSFTAR